MSASSEHIPATAETAPELPAGARALLARYPGPLVLTASRVWAVCWLGLAAALLVWSIGLIWAGRGGDGGIAILLAGAFGTAGLLGFIPGGTSLTLDVHGFEIRKFAERRLWRWTEVGDVAVWSGDEGDVGVMFQGGPPSPGSRPSASPAIAERYESLPILGGLWPDELALLLNAWRRRALGQGGADERGTG